VAPRQRRERGEGAIFYDATKDRWVGQLDLGTDADGRRRRPKVFGRTRAEVRSKLDELRTASKAGQAVDQRALTFSTLADDWMEKGLPAETAPTTRSNYETLINTHLRPGLGKKKVADLRPNDIEAVLEGMAAKGYSTRTMRLSLNLTKRILTFAERRGILLRNPATTVQPQRGAATPRRGLTTDEARALLTAAEGHRLHALITLSLLLGLRPGEATALTWDRVDLHATPPTITIEASLRRDGNRMVLGPVKTTTSRRTLALPHTCATALHDQRRRQEQDRAAAGGKWANPDNLVFTTDVGTPLDPSNVRHALQRIANDAGIGHVHPHLLRHAAASLLSEAGLRIEDIADTLGHRSITVTADVYRHPLNPVRTAHLTALDQVTTQPAQTNNGGG